MQLTTVLPRLTEDAFAAWQAYNAMEATKLRHFHLLTSLEEKYQEQGSASAQEQALLARLLSDHDRQVGAFKQAIGRLRERNPEAHDSLLRYISALNAALAPFQGEQVDAKVN